MNKKLFFLFILILFFVVLLVGCVKAVDQPPYTHKVELRDIFILLYGYELEEEQFSFITEVTNKSDRVIITFIGLETEDSEIIGGILLYLKPGETVQKEIVEKLEVKPKKIIPKIYHLR